MKIMIPNNKNLDFWLNHEYLVFLVKKDKLRRNIE